MQILLYWFTTYISAIAITLTLCWSIFYTNNLFMTSGSFVILGNQITSVWGVRIFFYFLFLPIHLICFLSICWVYSKANWFDGKLWVISITFLIADRLSTAFWIWYFKSELPDMWMVWGMVSLLFCMSMSAVSHR